MKKLFLGTSGFVYRGWKGAFYPQKLPVDEWLAYYSKEFNTVEINVSFYRTVKYEEYARWYRQTPKNFIFTVKGHRYITQQKKLHEVKDSLERVYEGTEALQDKLAVMLWQFPKQFQAGLTQVKRLQLFLDMLPKTHRHAFEFRHESWFNKPTYTLLQSYNACLVFGDSSLYPLKEEVTADFIYIRFHGPQDLYAGSYPDDVLQTWAEKIKTYRVTHDVYVYFNNDIDGHAVENARTLRGFL